MKLYCSAGTCSFAAHIVAREAGVPLELERVNIHKTPHVTASGADFSALGQFGAKMTNTLPTLFVGHGNPMNAVADNSYTAAWRSIGKICRNPSCSALAN